MRPLFDALSLIQTSRDPALAGPAVSPAEALSHDLRSPLTVIRCCAEALRDDPDMAPRDRARLTALLLEAEARLEEAIARAVTAADESDRRARRLEGDALRPR
ncbi:MAG: histidine kinase dimerization/phospho-acceptor domain-containing protein [Pseudomonadota bacterium]